MARRCPEGTEVLEAFADFTKQGEVIPSITLASTVLPEVDADQIARLREQYPGLPGKSARAVIAGALAATTANRTELRMHIASLLRGQSASSNPRDALDVQIAPVKHYLSVYVQSVLTCASEVAAFTDSAAIENFDEAYIAPAVEIMSTQMTAFLAHVSDDPDWYRSSIVVGASNDRAIYEAQVFPLRLLYFLFSEACFLFPPGGHKPVV